MYGKTHRRFRNNQQFTGIFTGLLFTYSVTLTRELRNSRERESHERQTDETDRRVADDDVTSESHKSIAQTKSHKRSRTNEVAQNNADVTDKSEMAKRRLGHSRATQVRMEDLRLVNLTEICPIQRVGHFKAPC